MSEQEEELGRIRKDFELQRELMKINDKLRDMPFENLLMFQEGQKENLEAIEARIKNDPVAAEALAEEHSNAKSAVELVNIIIKEKNPPYPLYYFIIGVCLFGLLVFLTLISWTVFSVVSVWK